MPRFQESGPFRGNVAFFQRVGMFMSRPIFFSFLTVGSPFSFCKTRQWSAPSFCRRAVGLKELRWYFPRLLSIFFISFLRFSDFSAPLWPRERLSCGTLAVMRTLFTLIRMVFFSSSGHFNFIKVDSTALMTFIGTAKGLGANPSPFSSSCVSDLLR